MFIEDKLQQVFGCIGTKIRLALIQLDEFMLFVKGLESRLLLLLMVVVVVVVVFVVVNLGIRASAASVAHVLVLVIMQVNAITYTFLMLTRPRVTFSENTSTRKTNSIPSIRTVR